MMKLTLAACALWIAVIAQSATAGPSAEQTRAEFEAIAKEMPYLATECVLYDRDDHHFDIVEPALKELHFRLLTQATSREHDRTSLRELLQHADPKVRTLALVALFDREEPKILPDIVSLADDAAPTFDGHPELSPSWLQRTGIGPPKQANTVGDIATGMVNFYLERAGFYYGIVHKTEKGFSEYWQVRKDRDYCASWFRVAVDRAIRGTSPLGGECIDRLKAVRSRIDQLPQDDRAWTLLWLRDPWHDEHLVTNNELVALCTQLGSDKLKLMLEHKVPSLDPDLHNGQNHDVMGFVLHHAETLLDKDDCDWLLERQLFEFDYRARNDSNPFISPWWAIAAAELRPDRAREILYSSIGRFQGQFDAGAQVYLYAALWRIVGESERFFIQDWLFNQMPDGGTVHPGKQGMFISAIAADRSSAPLIAFLLNRSVGRNGFNWGAVEACVRAANQWADEPVITEDELRKAWHPLGSSSLNWEEAEKQYPQETRALERLLRDWVNRLKATIPRWCPDCE